jgi:hypothetical protein
MPDRFKISLKRLEISMVVLIFVLSLTILTGCSQKQKADAPVASTVSGNSSGDRNSSSTLFGIPTDSLRIIKGKIRANTFLSDILESYGVKPRETDQIIRNSKGIFNVRHIKTGNNFTILADSDSTARLRYFIYENDPSLYYIFSFNDSLHIIPYRVNTRTEIKFSSLTIESSLWDALIGNGSMRGRWISLVYRKATDSNLFMRRTLSVKRLSEQEG